MQHPHPVFNLKNLAIAVMACQGVTFDAAAAVPAPSCKLLTAARFFDGINPPQIDMSVLVVGDKVQAVGTYAQLSGQCATRYNLGDATILPGFIESHAHVTFQNVSKEKVLEHGITTVQDTGGPLLPPQGGNGTLRLLSTGPIIQAQGGYPLNIFSPDDAVGGYDKIGFAIAPGATMDEVKTVVRNLVAGGATAIKIALEVGGEAGAPWMMSHGHGDVPAAPWNVLSQEQVQWIVDEAHSLNKRVIAHVGEDTGFELAFNAGVDELAHMPCAKLNSPWLHAAVHNGMKFVSTIDTLASCGGAGIYDNAHAIGHVAEEHPDEIGFPFIYGSEIAHDNVPWGINGEELHLMLHLTSGAAIEFPDVMNVLKSATSEAGARLGTGIPGLGTLTPGAPADVIAVKGNPLERFKLLEYPDLVMSGGKLVVYKFPQVR